MQTEQAEQAEQVFWSKGWMWSARDLFGKEYRIRADTKEALEVKVMRFLKQAPLPDLIIEESVVVAQTYTLPDAIHGMRRELQSFADQRKGLVK